MPAFTSSASLSTGLAGVARVLPVAAAVSVSASVAMTGSAGHEAVAAVWPAFVLVAGLLILGALAHRDGLFELVAAGCARLPLPGAGLFVASGVLVVVVTTFLNLDTAVVFLTPVLIALAHRRGLDPLPFAYLAVFAANAGSLLLPGSNLTNLIVLGEHAGSGTAFLERMWPAALAAPVATMAVLAAAHWRRLRRATDPPRGEIRAQRTMWATGGGILVSAVLVVALEHPALPVLAVAGACAAWAMRRGATTWRAITAAMSLPALCGLFGAAVLVGWLARTVPAAELFGAMSAAASAGVAALAAMLVNNLPAAAWLSAQPLGHPEAILVGLNVGPNLGVTGSLSALLWWQAATRSGVRPSILGFSLLGGLCGVAGIAAALGALAGWGPA